MTSRRDFLTGALALPLAGQIISPAWAANAPNLGQLAAAKGMFFGAATTSAQLVAGDAYQALLAEQCGVYTAEWESKWGAIEWDRGYRNYDSVDAIVRSAMASGKKVRGHTLLWHLQLPPWAEAQVLNGPADWDQLVAPFISEIAARYAGDIFQWDVVNEAIDPEWQEPDGLRKTPFLEMRGRGYIADAFHLAAAAAPDCRLFINDYSLYYADDFHEKRRVAMLALLERLVAQGVPVHGLGIQGHLQVGREFSAKRFGAFLDEVAALGLDIAITELDVDEVHDLTGDHAARDQRNADEVRQVLDVAFQRPNLTGVVTWSLADPVSYTRVSGRLPNSRGLPFDDTLAPTAMHTVLADLFRQASDRRARSTDM